MASNPMQQCCIVGVIHQGTPKGVIKSIGNIRAYFACPPDNCTHNAIILMADVFGIEFRNTQLIADQFAANGYFTVIPDVFNGNQVPWPPPSDFNLQTWIETKMPRPITVDPIYETVIQHLRGQMGVKRLGAAGYCFGGKYVCRWLKPGGADAGYTAHPSFVDAGEVRSIKGPLSIAAAETDDIFTVEKRRETEEILANHTVPYQIFLYGDVEHGFATKGDLSHAKAKFAKEQAFLQAVLWFDEYVKKGPIPSR